MRSEYEFKLNQIWYGGEPVPWWLRVLVPVYKAGNRLDKWWKLNHRPDDLGSVFIIVVGNITVGGSGKTPLVIRLCHILRQAGFNPGVISRGYGRKERGLRLVSVTQQLDFNGAAGKLIASVLFAVAEMEQETRRERQAAGIAVAKSRGKYRGRKAGSTKGKPARAVRLREQGLADSEIASALGVSRRSVQRYLAAGATSRQTMTAAPPGASMPSAAWATATACIKAP